MALRFAYKSRSFLSFSLVFSGFFQFAPITHFGTHNAIRNIEDAAARAGRAGSRPGSAPRPEIPGSGYSCEQRQLSFRCLRRDLLLQAVDGGLKVLRVQFDANEPKSAPDRGGSGGA